MQNPALFASLTFTRFPFSREGVLFCFRRDARGRREPPGETGFPARPKAGFDKDHAASPGTVLSPEMAEKKRSTAEIMVSRSRTLVRAPLNRAL